MYVRVCVCVCVEGGGCVLSFPHGASETNHVLWHPAASETGKDGPTLNINAAVTDAIASMCEVLRTT